MNKLCVILLCFPALLFGQQTIIKEIKIKPYMYTQNYEHFKRLVLDSPLFHHHRYKREVDS